MATFNVAITDSELSPADVISEDSWVTPIAHFFNY